MKRIGTVLAVAALIAVIGSSSYAGDFKLVINIGRPVYTVPAPVVVYQPAPVVYQPAPVVYQPAPVVYQPAPVVYQPVVLTRPPVVMHAPYRHDVERAQVYQQPIYVRAPIVRPVCQPSITFTLGNRRDDDSFRHGRYVYQSVTRPGGSSYYRRIRQND